MSTTTGRESYAVWLSRQLDERAFTVRSFAKKMNPEAPEIARRSLRRYLKGMVPIDRTKREIADHLGCTEIGPDADDDAEGD